MTKTFLTIFISLLVTSLAIAQTRQSPYIGQESNKIKSLSSSEIHSYLNGEGMGLAKAAELNSYPGPKHVLELANILELSPAQKDQTQQSFDRMKRSAIRIGKMIVNSEAQLSELFASGQIDERKLQSLTQRIARYEGELRRTHLKAHLEMKRILSSRQIKKYDELRGYRKEVKSDEHEHHKHDDQ